MILIIAIITIIIVAILNIEWDFDGLSFFMLTATTVLIIALFMYPTFYYLSGDAMSSLETDYRINLQNSKVVMETLNERAAFQNQTPGAILDAPNMGQSQRTSEAVVSYVGQINKFNENLRGARFKRSINPIFRFLIFGTLAPIPSGIDYIIM